MNDMSGTAENPAKDAVAYHRGLATGWEQRYQKPAFRARVRVLKECLAGRDLRNQEWLDAGCGSGTLTRFLAEAGARVLGVDAAEDMIAMARTLGSQDECKERMRFEHIETIADLPLGDESVDGVLCSSVLEYMTDPHACLAEFARVLHPGGVLVVSVPNRHSLVRRAQVGAHRVGRLLKRHWFPFLDFSHNEYTLSGFVTLLKENGFTTGKGIPFGSPIPHWLQRREFGGSLLAFCATRE